MTSVQGSPPSTNPTVPAYVEVTESPSIQTWPVTPSAAAYAAADPALCRSETAVGAKVVWMTKAPDRDPVKWLVDEAGNAVVSVQPRCQ
jgi:hypothetical protein